MAAAEETGARSQWVKSEFDGWSGDAANRPYANPPPDTKWWLHNQTSSENQKQFSHEQLDCLEPELEVFSARFVNQTAKLGGKDQSHPFKEHDTQTDSKMKIENLKEFNAVNGSSFEKGPNNKDMGEFWYKDEVLMNLDAFNGLVSEQSGKLCSDLETHLFGGEKNEPWWRTADKDELASFVSHKLLTHIENCDLPWPQTKNFVKGTSSYRKNSDHGNILSSSFDRQVYKEISNVADCTHQSPSSVSLDKTLCNLDDVGCSLHGPDILFSNNNPNTKNTEMTETDAGLESELNKAQLLEALCHSQTRAREAEKAAQEAYDEKEHIVKLFLKQASHLFAYKQWFQILQLETLCIQLRNKKYHPNFSPWVPYKGRPLQNGRNRAAKRKVRTPRYGVGKCAFAFAVGLSLAGAGLLLGWTMGWLFPSP